MGTWMALLMVFKHLPLFATLLQGPFLPPSIMLIALIILDKLYALHCRPSQNCHQHGAQHCHVHLVIYGPFSYSLKMLHPKHHLDAQSHPYSGI